MRTRWLTCVLLAGGCSFVDDFDKFGPQLDDAGKDARVEAIDGVENDGVGTDGVGNDGKESADSGKDAAAQAGLPRDAGGGGRPELDASTDQTSRDTGVQRRDDASAGASGTGVDATAPRTDDDAGALTEMDAAISSTPDAGNGSGEGETCATPLVTCYPDRDRDRYPDLTGAPELRCACRPDQRQVVGRIDSALQSSQHDCWDGDSADDLAAGKVHPGQKQSFGEPYVKPSAPPSYDYNCSGEEEPEVTTTVPASGCAGLLDLLLCDGVAGFLGELPACGQESNFVSCSKAVLALSCTGTSVFRRQLCR